MGDNNGVQTEEPEIFGYYYGEEDMGLLDPAWEKQQKKVRFLFYSTYFQTQDLTIS